MVFIDLSKFINSEYVKRNEETEEWELQKDAPQDIVDLYKRYREILDEEKRIGRHIF